MQNARIIKSALTNAYNEGRMDIPKKAVGQENSGCGVWVVICRSTSELPDAYTSDMLNEKKYLLWSKFRSYSKRCKKQ